MYCNVEEVRLSKRFAPLNVEDQFVEEVSVVAVLFTNLVPGIVLTRFFSVDTSGSSDGVVRDEPVYVGCYEVEASNPFYELTTDEAMTVEVSVCVDK